MKKYITTFLSLAVSLLILILLIFYVQPSKILQDFEKISLHYYPFLLLITFIVFIIQTYRFIIYLKAQGEKEIVFSKASFAYFIGLFLAVIVPFRAVGEFAKAWVFTREIKIKFSKTFAAVTVERIYDLLLFIFSALLFILFVDVTPVITLQFTIFIILFTSAFLFLIFIFKLEKFRNFILKTLKKINKAVSVKIKEYLDNFTTINKSAKVFLISSFTTIVMWFLDAFRVILIFNFLGIKANIFVALSILYLSYIISSISFLPGGLGSFELVFFILYKVLGYGNVALTVALIERIFTYWLFVILGAILYFTFEFKRIPLKKIFKKA